MPHGTTLEGWGCPRAAAWAPKQLGSAYEPKLRPFQKLVPKHRCCTSIHFCALYMERAKLAPKNAHKRSQTSDTVHTIELASTHKIMAAPVTAGLQPGILVQCNTMLWSRCFLHHNQTLYTPKTFVLRRSSLHLRTGHSDLRKTDPHQRTTTNPTHHCTRATHSQQQLSCNTKLPTCMRSLCYQAGPIDHTPFNTQTITSVWCATCGQCVRRLLSHQHTQCLPISKHVPCEPKPCAAAAHMPLPACASPVRLHHDLLRLPALPRQRPHEGWCQVLSSQQRVVQDYAQFRQVVWRQRLTRFQALAQDAGLLAV